jgi:hypothetical protein
MMTPTQRRLLRLCLAMSLGITTESRVVCQSRYTPYRLMPVDQASEDPSFLAFRTRLIEAVRRRDADRVFEATEPELGKQWAAGLTDGFFRDLDRILALGGTFTTMWGSRPGRREFCAPYAYSLFPDRHKWPEDLSEVLEEDEPWVVVGSAVAVRRRPSISARVIARLTYDLVPVDSVDRRDESGAPYIWQTVQLPDGRKGWVEASLLWGHRESHACFAQVNGQWQMTAFGLGYH